VLRDSLMFHIDIVYVHSVRYLHSYTYN